MTTSLISRAMMMAHNIRRSPKGLISHGDRGSQYTRKPYRALLTGYGIRAAVGSVGACWDNAVVERFFGVLKYDWIFRVHQPARVHMTIDERGYIKYYDLERLHISNCDLTPLQYKKSAH